MDVMLFSGLYHMLKQGVTAGFFCVIAVLSCLKSLLRVNISHPQSCGRGRGFQLLTLEKFSKFSSF